MASGGVMGGGWRPVIPVPSPNNTERTPEFTLELVISHQEVLLGLGQGQILDTSQFEECVL